MPLSDREITAATDTPTSADDRKMLSATYAVAPVAVTLDTEASQGWAKNTVMHLRRDTAQPVSIIPASGVTAQFPNGQLVGDGVAGLQLVPNGVASMVYDDADVWTITGDLAASWSVPAVLAASSLVVGAEHCDSIVRIADAGPIAVEFVEDDTIPVGAGGEIVQWGNGALSLVGTGVVLVSLDADLTLAGLYSSIMWTKLDATTYFIRGALAVERTMTWDGVEIATNVWSTPGFCAQAPRSRGSGLVGHFAEVDGDGIVQRVIVAASADWCAQHLGGGSWVETADPYSKDPTDVVYCGPGWGCDERHPERFARPFTEDTDEDGQPAPIRAGEVRFDPARRQIVRAKVDTVADRAALARDFDGRLVRKPTDAERAAGRMDVRDLGGVIDRSR